MSLTGNNIIAGSSGQSTGYDIDQSLRFDDGSSPTLSRTPASAGNRKTWTWSCWLKRSDTSTYQVLFGTGNFRSGSSYGGMYFEGTGGRHGCLYLYDPANSCSKQTTAQFRDPSAWYHIVGVMDATNTVARIYINNEEQTDFITNVNPTNTDGNFNDNTLTFIGGNASTSVDYLDGYLAEVHLIDGQALTPSSFAETDADTNQWQAIKYAGSYGTNGFYLKFQDSSALGDDSSGNTNDFAVTNLVATDQMIDTPTNNYCTMNPLAKASSAAPSYTSLKEGNLHLEAGGQGSVMSTFAMSSGQWYWECLVTIAPSWWPVVGFGKTTAAVGLGNQNYTGEQAGSWGYKTDGGQFYIDGSINATYTSVSAGDIMQFALDMDAGKAWVGINDTWVNSGVPASGTNAIVTSGLTGDITPIFSDSGSGHDLVANFGQDSSFAGAKTAQGNGGTGEDFYYTPPAGFKALNSDNLSDPAIALPTDHFDTVLYTGGASFSKIETGFAPDLNWIKARSTTYPHILSDSVRGVSKYIQSNDTAIEVTDVNFVTSFDSDGVSIGQTSYINADAITFAAWNWKGGGAAVSNTDGSTTSSVSANTTAGFSIVKYAGNDTAGNTVGHGLSQAPELVITKNLGTVFNWVVSTENVTGTTDQYLVLNDTAAASTNSNYWQSVGASLLTFGDSSAVNQSSRDFIAYCFHSVEGYSKVGSYTGANSTDANFIYCGFKPALVLLKNSGAAEQWCLYDDQRNPYNVVNDRLRPDSSAAEAVHGALDFVSNGFKIRSADISAPQGYIFYAVASSPFKTSNAR